MIIRKILKFDFAPKDTSFCHFFKLKIDITLLINVKMISDKKLL